MTSFADWLNEDVVTVADDEALLGLIPTLIKETFPAVWESESLDVVPSLEPDVPG